MCCLVARTCILFFALARRLRRARGVERIWAKRHHKGHAHCGETLLRGGKKEANLGNKVGGRGRSDLLRGGEAHGRFGAYVIDCRLRRGQLERIADGKRQDDSRIGIMTREQELVLVPKHESYRGQGRCNGKTPRQRKKTCFRVMPTDVAFPLWLYSSRRDLPKGKCRKAKMVVHRYLWCEIRAGEPTNMYKSRCKG